MSEQRVPITRVTWSRFGRALKDFANCEVGWRARGLFGLLIALLVVFNALNVLNSYVGRDFMTAISNRDSAGFTRQAIAYLAVFGASTLVGAFYSFSEQRLGLLWREWLTRQLLGAYLHRRAYYRLSAAGVLTNPDERIAEDPERCGRERVEFARALCEREGVAEAMPRGRERGQAGHGEVVVHDEGERAPKSLLRAGVEARVAALADALLVGEPEKRQPLGILRIRLDAALELRDVGGRVPGREPVEQATRRDSRARLRRGRPGGRVAGHDAPEEDGRARHQRRRSENVSSLHSRSSVAVRVRGPRPQAGPLVSPLLRYGPPMEPWWTWS